MLFFFYKLTPWVLSSGITDWTFVSTLMIPSFTCSFNLLRFWWTVQSLESSPASRSCGSGLICSHLIPYDKTEVLVIGSRSQTAKDRIPNVIFSERAWYVLWTLSTIWVHVFDSRVTMGTNVTAVCRSARFHLRNIEKIRRHLTAEACERLVHVLVSCRLDLMPSSWDCPRI